MRHLFFDLDRTLWDFERNSETALQSLYEDLKLADHLRSFTSFHTQYKKINGMLWDQYSRGAISKELLRVKRFSDTLEHFGVNHSELSNSLAKGYVERSPYQTHLLPNTIETLIQLKKEGYPLHIITNGFKEVQFIKLRQSKLEDYFDVILCSEEVGVYKPSVQVYQEALQRSGASAKNSVMIGDSYLADVVGAENSGFQAILFDPHRKHKDDAHRWLIRDLKRVPEILPFIPRT